MKTLQTQFDAKRLSTAVATPTCSSCCCCCCCLATTLSTSSLLAQRINKESTKKQMPSSTLLTVLAALFVPVVGVLVYFGFWTINMLFKTCTERSYGGTYGGSNTYTVCTNPAAGWLIPLLIIVPCLVLWFLYRQVAIRNPFNRAMLVTFLVAVAFVAEFFGGAALILTGVGGIVYLLLVPVIIGWISVWYHNHIGAEVDMTPAAASAAAPIFREPGGIYPTATKGPLATHEDPTTTPPTEPQEPPQQNPPAAGAQ